MKILVFDNYDSFTYNLVHLVKKVMPDAEVEVHRNDQITLKKIEEYDKIILSPGPGLPSEAGLLLAVIKQYAPTKSILGVCLGHQAIGEAFGGSLVNLSTVYHGVALPVRQVKSEITNGRSGLLVSPLATPSLPKNLFEGLPDEFMVGRYHSWVISNDDFPDELEITAVDENGYIMALQHTRYDVQAVQFHPESVLTPDGEIIMRNWLKS
jgi:anthranilate synthase component 2